MIPTYTETPLRRSGIGGIKTSVQIPIVNDDEEERRQRRRTVLENENNSTTSSTNEDNETLKNCIKICNENKLSKENAWQVSVIDTLSKLLEKHHKVMHNFKVVGSSLEASSKVYGLRVDSIHTDVVRLSAGLNKRKVTEKNDGNESQINDNDTEQTQTQNNENQILQPKVKRKKRTRKNLSTVTKNKETINGKLDTHPFTDPIFAKLNSISGSINSSNRLLQNILSSVDSEIILRMDYPFWDSNPSPDLTLTDEYNYENYDNLNFIESYLIDSISTENLNLRTIHTGYTICDTPAETDGNDKESVLPLDDDEEKNESQLAMAFDINADVEPIVSEIPGFMDVDVGELDDLTTEEEMAIAHCRGLRRPAVVIDNMRPLDSTSANLEYSYRPMDKISQYWAGPSHWKFKRTTKSSSMSLAQRFSQHSNYNLTKSRNNGEINNMKNKTSKSRSKKRGQDKEIQFDKCHDDLFVKFDQHAKKKLKKACIEKKWDSKKLKLPTDLKIDMDIFDHFEYAPGLKIRKSYCGMDDSITPDIPDDYQIGDDDDYCEAIRENIGTLIDGDRSIIATQNGTQITQNIEIATVFDGAPEKINRIIVPFARRAKVVDMKQLKKCCLHIIKNQFAAQQSSTLDKENVPNDLITHQNNDEKYKNGCVNFSKIYSDLPDILSPNMSKALSRPIAFYSILHLANETNLRLLPQNDLNDFKILQLDNLNKETK